MSAGMIDCSRLLEKMALSFSGSRFLDPLSYMSTSTALPVSLSITTLLPWASLLASSPTSTSSLEKERGQAWLVEGAR